MMGCERICPVSKETLRNFGKSEAHDISSAKAFGFIFGNATSRTDPKSSASYLSPAPGLLLYYDQLE